MRYVEKIEVLEKNGKRTIIRAYDTDVLDDGYMYFYSPGIIRRVPLTDIRKLTFYGRSVGTPTKIVSFVVSNITMTFADSVLKDYIQKLCPSDHPIVKMLWKISEKIAVFGFGCVANYIVSTSVENTIQPFIDGVQIGREAAKQIIDNLKGAQDDEVQIKEVFEESDNNESN